MSAVESGRTPSSAPMTMGSPFRWGMTTGASSASKRPAAAAAPARRCDSAANSSCASRVRPSLDVYRSVDAPIESPSNASVSPSCAAESSAVIDPYDQPRREPGRTCGALVIDSWPPATTTSASPERMSRAASMIAASPERQTLLMVTVGTCQPSPAAIEVWRAGFWPAPACSTWPKISASTSAAPTAPAPPAESRSSAARTATAPRSTARNEARPPLILPCGVRAADRMTTSVLAVMATPSWPGKRLVAARFHDLTPGTPSHANAFTGSGSPQISAKRTT